MATATVISTTIDNGALSRLCNRVETEGETGHSRCGDHGRMEKRVEERVAIDIFGGPTGSGEALALGRRNIAKLMTEDVLQQQQPTTPLTPIPTDSFNRPLLASSSSTSACLAMFQQQSIQSALTERSICMTSPSRTPSLFATAVSSPDHQFPPGTVFMTSPSTPTTTQPLSPKVIRPVLMHNNNNKNNDSNHNYNTIINNNNTSNNTICLEQQQQQVDFQLPTLRAKPKPSPITTKSFACKSNSLGSTTSNSSSNNNITTTASIQKDTGEECVQAFGNNSNNITTQFGTVFGLGEDVLQDSPVDHRKGCNSDEETTQDSGVVLESWDQSLLHQQAQDNLCPSDEPILTNPIAAAQTSKQYLSESLFPNPQVLTRGPKDQKIKRRQRCRSMICPPTPREIETDDRGFRSNDDADHEYHNSSGTTTVSSNSSNDIPAGTKPSETKLRRSKRVASMSIGNDQSQHSSLNIHGLPPLPPLTATTSNTSNNSNNTKIPRSSFFCSPSFHDSISDDSSSNDSGAGRNSKPCRSSQLCSGDSTNSISSSLTSLSASAAIPISQPSSPPNYQNHHHSYPSFAHGIPFSNMLDLATAKAENITGLYFAKQMNNHSMAMEPGYEGVSEEDDLVKKRTRAATSTGSLAHHNLTSTTALGNVTSTEDLEGNRIAGSPFSVDASSIPSEPAQTTSKAATATSKGQHRRSHSASHFFHLSSLKRHSPAQFNLALCYEHGQGGVEQNLAKAVHFYQQAADQGHTKASYNLGCICYNQGEISKAMAWFESAGKCNVQGLKMNIGALSSTPVTSTTERQKIYTQVLECPMPKATTIPRELEDMLMLDDPSGCEGATTDGPGATAGPFVAYIPAILCLALLCRQGVQTRGGEVILRRDPDQAVVLLKKLLDRAPARLLNRLEVESQSVYSPRNRQIPDERKTSSSIGSSKKHPRKRASLQTMPILLRQSNTLTALLSTSCPQLPLGHSASMSTLASLTNNDTCSSRRRSTVEDSSNNDDRSFYCANKSLHNHAMTQDTQQTPESRQDPFLEPEWSIEEGDELHGSDVHEAWSVTFAQQLLKVWQQPSQPPTSSFSRHGGQTEPRSRAASASTTPGDSRIQQRVVRHHLLYITNPTLGKNFYNLGVLYDLYLGNSQIAQRCYRSAYQSCHPSIIPISQPAQPVQDVISTQSAKNNTGQINQRQQQLARLVTRINSAWNLGVLYAKHQEWARARGWFLKAQQDVHAHELITANFVTGSPSDAEMRSDPDMLLTKSDGVRRGAASGDNDQDITVDKSAFTTAAVETKQMKTTSRKEDKEENEFQTRRRSLVNVLPSPGGQQSNTSARNREGSRGRSRNNRNNSKGRPDHGVNPELVFEDSLGNRHAQEHGLVMHLSASSTELFKQGGGPCAVEGSIKSQRKSDAYMLYAGGEGQSGVDGIRTDASKVAWVLRWVESNMETPPTRI
ncbi:hypothetical protein FBU30_007953 [Linnemannia zychae]|nr:hypothetical protein FBU30_007953 [Linnemannia zychae]